MLASPASIAATSGDVSISNLDGRGIVIGMLKRFLRFDGGGDIGASSDAGGALGSLRRISRCSTQLVAGSES